MRKIHAPRLLAATTVVAGLALLPSGATAAETAISAPAKATVKDVNNGVLGTVTLRPTRDGTLRVDGRLVGLAPGFHGFHIHQTGVCDPAATDPAGNPTPFSTAGGHLNPAGVNHGAHAGDLPLLLVTQDGRASSLTETSAVDFAAIFDADGAALIVHAAPDNYANIPARYSAGGVPGPDAATNATGDAGGRVGCGVITR